MKAARKWIHTAGFMGLLVLVWMPAIPCMAGAAANAGDIPRPARLVLHKSSILKARKDYTGAIKILTAFLSGGGPVPAPGDPDPKGRHHPEIYFALGNCYLLQADYASAAKAYQQALKRDGSHSHAWLNLAKVYYEQEAYVQAGECFSRGYETADEKQPEHLYYSAAAFLTAGQYSRSAAAFERLMKSHPDRMKPEWQAHFVHALLNADQAKRALPYIKSLTRIYTGDKRVQWQELLLYQYLQMNMTGEALAYALELTRESPLTAKWWKALAHVRLNAISYKEALVALTVYGWLTPLDATEQKLLADLNLQLNIPVKAVPFYEALLARKPDKGLLKKMVLAYQQIDQPEAALKGLERFAGYAADPEVLMLKADLLYALGRFDDAAAAYQRAAENNSGQAGRAWLMAGYAAWQAEDLGTSRQAFKRAAGYGRQRKAALLAMRQLRQKP